MINTCWFCFKWGLLLAAVGAAATAAYFYHRMDEEIRCHVEQRIAQHYTGLKVTIRSAELLEGEGIEIRGLSILEPGAEGPRAELLYCDEVFLSCPAEVQDLIREEPQVSRITFRRPTLRATRRPDGTWSVAKLLPLPKLSEHPPEVIVENGTVEILDPLRTPASTLMLPNVNLTFSPPDPSGPTPHARNFRGTLSADHLRGVEINGQVNPHVPKWTISGTVEGLEISPELRDALPGPLAAKLAVLGGLRGHGTLGFRVSYDPAAAPPYRFDLSGRLVRGRLDDPRLPHPLTDMRARVHLSNEGFAIDELVARSNQATLRVISARQSGYELGKSPLTLKAEIRQLELDRQLFERLPQALQEQWHKYRPEGRINADLALRFDGRTWHPDLSAECLNVSFSHYKFPYPLEHGNGLLTWKETANGDWLTADLTAYSGSQQVRLRAEVLHPTSGPTGWFEAKGDGLQLDKKLLDALNEKSRAFVSSLNPSGTVDFYVRMGREMPEGPLKKHIVIGLNRCSVRYEKFPYPLSNIGGTLEMRDDDWTFHGLEGTNDTGRVTCEQGWLTSSQQGRELYLRFVGTNVPLEEELRDALPANVQRAWNNLRPQGMIDLAAEVHYLPEQKKLALGVTAYPKGDSTSIEPVHLPYRLEKLHGALVYRDGRVTLCGRNLREPFKCNPRERFKAEHGPMKLATSGYCDLLPDARWNLQFEGLTIDGLGLDDRNLIQAMPERLKKAVAELQPGGLINLQGDLNLKGGPGTGDPIRSRWDLTATFRPGASINCGVKLENLSGGAKLAGASDGRQFHCRGELDIDSLSYKDYQLTQVRGPIWIDDRQVLLGSWVDRRRSSGPSPRQPRPLTARLFGGTVLGDGWITRGPDQQYGLRATLSQGDLSRFAQEVMAGRQHLRGTILAAVELAGRGRSLNGMAGRGVIQLRQADIYELPLVIALLKILSIREPDQTAFNKSDIGFTVQGNHIYLKPINLYGDAISLLGQGEMDFESRINLTFHAVVGRDELYVPVLRELMGGASQRILQIRAKGTLQNPKTEKVALPFVKEVWEQLQNELQIRPDRPGLLPQARHWIIER